MADPGTRTPGPVLGLIVGRAGSKGVPGKNGMPLDGEPLIARAVRTARESRRLDRLLCSTEDPDYARLAREAGAEVPFMRPASLSRDDSSVWDVVRHAVDWLEEHEAWQPDIIVLLPANIPFRRGAHIDAALARLLESSAESVLSVRRVDYPPEWMMRMDGDGRLTPLLDPAERPLFRQDARPSWQPNGAIYAMRRSALDRPSPMPTGDTLAYEMSFGDSVNIDLPWQFELARIFCRDPEAAGV